MSRLMTWVFATSCLAYAAVVWWSAGVLPEDRVPIHWSTFGSAADDWTTRAGAVQFFVIMGAGTAILFVALLALLRRNSSLVGINIPNKAYWTRPENLPEVRRLLRTDLALLGALTMGLMTTMPLSVAAASGRPNGESPVWSDIALVVWLVLVLGQTFWMMISRYRVPDDPHAGV